MKSERRNVMKHKISTHENGLEIKISNVQEKHSELLHSFELCQKGQCDCPTDQYNKLEELNIQSFENEIILDLKAKEGEKFDGSEIEKCVDFTIKKAEGTK